MSLINILNDRTEFNIRVTPKASSNRIKIETGDDGQPVIRVYVTCVPEDGKANKAVLDLLAKELGVPKTSLTVLRGNTGREKIISIRK
jgi:uncharacterized protein YggU (UPF0235/DUF167 family)